MYTLQLLIHYVVTEALERAEGLRREWEAHLAQAERERQQIWAQLQEKNKDHRWNRNPRPRPQKYSKLVFLIETS